jgi:predicted transcriptional regulator
MTLEEVKEILNAEVISGSADLQMEIKMGCGCDLMSDVLAFIKSDSLLLTGLTNPQVIRTAEIADVKAICFVRGKKPDEETIKLAESKGFPLLMTNLPLFESCGRLYKKGLCGCSEYRDS